MMTSQDFFAKASQYITEQQPMVIYRKPERKSAAQYTVEGFFQQNDELYFPEDFTEKGFVFAPFRKKKQSVLFPIEKSERITTVIAKEKTEEQIGDKPLLINEEDKQIHLNLVVAGIEAIRQKELEKVVLSRRLSAKTEKNPIDIFMGLLKNYPTAFVYCWYHPKVGLWLGATPETLLATTGNRLKTMAVAGTKRAIGEQPPKWTAKERHEQQVVTDAINAVLAPRMTNLSVSKPQDYRAGNLWHLKTDFSGIVSGDTSRGNPWREIIEKLHPTPAICGLPKEKAARFIAAHENYNREFYSGFLGELNMTVKPTRAANRRNQENQAYAIPTRTTNLYVNLRCMQLLGKQAHLYVGGGIVDDSEPESEWMETQHKAQTMLKVL